MSNGRRNDFILAGDMGLQGGLAYGTRNGSIAQWVAMDLRSARRRHGVAGALQECKRQILAFLKDKEPPNTVTYEEPTMNSRRGNLLQYGMIACLLTEIPVDQVTSVYPSSLKKFATRNGRASKEDMIKIACEVTGEKITDHNVADAILILQWERLAIKK